MFSDLSSALGFTCHGSVTVAKVSLKERVNIQVMVFLRWVRFLVVEVMWMRQHVIVNLDETQLASVRNHGTGMISGRKHKRADRRRAPRDAEDRHHTKVTYMAVISDSPELQPASASGHFATVYAARFSAAGVASQLCWVWASFRILARHEGSHHAWDR